MFKRPKFRNLFSGNTYLYESLRAKTTYLLLFNILVALSGSYMNRWKQKLASSKIVEYNFDPYACGIRPKIAYQEFRVSSLLLSMTHICYRINDSYL